MIPHIPVEVVDSARRGYLYPKWLVKQALLAESDVDRAFEEYKTILGLNRDDRLEPKRVASLHDAGREFGIQFLEIEPGGERIRIEPARVVGAGNQRPLEAVTRSVYLASLPDVQIRGRSALVEFEDTVLLDFEGDELARLDDQLDLDAAIFRAVDNRVWVLTPVTDAVRIEEAFNLVGPHTYAFGHWMWEYLPKYIVATILDRLPHVPVLIDEGMPETHREALDLILPDSVEVIELAQGMIGKVHRLWYAPTPMHMPVLEKMNERFRWDYLAASPRTFAQLIHEMNRRVDRRVVGNTSGSERVFLARKSSLHRKLVNHRTIEEAAVREGFTVIYPEDLSFRDQIIALRQARFVVGPEGSAMFLAFFARPGTRLCILNHPYTVGLAVLTSLLQAIGVLVTVLTGPCVKIDEEYPHFADYLIDVEAFERFLRDWVAESEA